MKRLILVFAMVTSAALAQEEPAFNGNKAFRNKVFTIQHRDPRSVLNALHLLGSGTKGADMTVSTELRTITVRDFPENIATIEEAIARLDKPVPAAPDMELKISVLIGSKSPLAATAAVPEELAPVVKQLQSTLSYAHYGLLTTTVHRSKTGIGVEGSGVAESALLGIKTSDTRPIFYTYQLRGVSVSAEKLDVDNFEFSMRVPLQLGEGNVQYQNVGFKTPVAVAQGERVVIGTTTMNDKALVVVVTAKVN
ncbi:MAG TPA: secretin N-terminal domain-containing protein [Thermoanaerobaculia bacterium]